MSADNMFLTAISKVVNYFRQENNSTIHSRCYQKNRLMLRQHQAIHSAIVGVAIPTLRISKRLAAKKEGKKH